MAYLSSFWIKELILGSRSGLGNFWLDHARELIFPFLLSAAVLCPKGHQAQKGSDWSSLWTVCSLRRDHLKETRKIGRDKTDFQG